MSAVLDQLALTLTTCFCPSPLIQSWLRKAASFTEAYSFSSDNYGHPHALLFCYSLPVRTFTAILIFSISLDFTGEDGSSTIPPCTVHTVSRRPALRCLPCGGNDFHWLNHAAFFIKNFFLLHLQCMFYVISPKFNRFIFCTELNDLKVHMEKQMQEFSRM